ncbi:hypothetical protein [Leifsonia sp. C5G2]|uniref:hypothetical protein n=1 Tax=Leifsonia sp. C5G2 TaxID=2735269 RepID=UPI001585354C|nr:hypothetical protein [Leifsonia sp. C5G2]NUU07648.1 hypothetical protein [Leifsonia sp. C5G2]
MPVRTAAPACDALATPQQAVALVGGSGEPQRFEHLPSGFLQSSWAALAANGAVCGWGENGLHELVGSTGTPWVFVRVVPGLADEWKTLAAELSPSAGAGYDGGVSRGGSCEQICSTDVLVGDAWLSVEANAATTPLDEAAFHTFVQGIVSRYRSLPQPTPVAMHAPRSCEDDRVRSAVSAAFGSKGVVHSNPPVFSLGEALQRAGLYTSCAYFSGGDRDTWETWITVVDHADPSLLATYRAAVDHPEARSVDASSLPAGAFALFEPSVDSQRTIVDTLSGSSWIDVVTYITSDSAASVGLASALTHSAWLG